MTNNTIIVDGEQFTIDEELIVKVVRHGLGNGATVFVAVAEPPDTQHHSARVFFTCRTEFAELTEESITEATAPVHEWIRAHQQESEHTS